MRDSQGKHSPTSPFTVYLWLCNISAQFVITFNCIVSVDLNKLCGESYGVTMGIAYLIFFRGPTLWVRILKTSVLPLSNAVRLLQ